MRAKAVSVGRVVIPEPQTFGNRVRPSFAKAIGILDANLKQLPQAGNEIALILRGSQGETVGGDQVALPFARGPRGAYWLSAKIVLEPFQNKYALKGVSLTVFRGEARSEKAPLVRAEWDCPVSVVNTHAQPHWHAYPGLISPLADGERTTVGLFQPQQAVFELPEVEGVRSLPESRGFTKVHLAMASTWHLAKNPQDRVSMVDESEVFAWIENCIKYLKDQLTSQL
jgi:hypothetical protein